MVEISMTTGMHARDLLREAVSDAQHKHGDALRTALTATLCEAVSLLGVTEDEIDSALAGAFGWWMTAGPEHLHPTGVSAALRTERFLKHALLAGDAAREAMVAAHALRVRGAA